MSDARSLEVYKGLREAQQKLDYFLLGLSSALFAYVGGQYEPMKIAVSQNTFELLALVLFLLSIFSGFKRINLHISLMRLNFKKLHLSERKGSTVSALGMSGQVVNTDTGEFFNKHEAVLMISEIDKILPNLENDMEKFEGKASFAYVVRNWTLVLGFIALGVSKFIGVYDVSTVA